MKVRSGRPLYDNHKVKPLHIVFPKATAYVKSYNGQTKWMCFFIENDDLLEKYNTIWDNTSADIKTGFDSEPVYNKAHLKTEIKSHGDEVTGFYDKKVPKLGCNHTYLAAITLDSALKKDDSYCRCKYF